MSLRPTRDPTQFPQWYNAAAVSSNHWNVGSYFWVTTLNGEIRGAVFYWGDTPNQVTLEFYLWEPNNDTAVRTKQIVIPASSPGIYEVLFDAVYVVDATAYQLQYGAGTFRASPWTGGFGVSYYCLSHALITNQWVGYTIQEPEWNFSYVGPGDASGAVNDSCYNIANSKPKTTGGGGHRFFIDPIVYGSFEELSSPPARIQLPAGYLDLFSSNAPAERIALINCIPEDTETGVKVAATPKLTVVSLDNVALDATTKVYFSIDGGAEQLVYDQAGGGFQAGWNGAASSATVQASPGSGVNDELVLVVDPTTDFASLSRVTVRVLASVSSGATVLDANYTFVIEDLTAPGLDSILWIDPRRCRLRFTEALLADAAPGGSLFMEHLRGGFEIIDSTTLQLMTEVPSASWAGYPLSLTGSVYPQNNKVRPVLSVDVSNRRLTLDTSGSYGTLSADTGVDKDTSGNVVRTRTMQLSISPWAFSARLADEGSGTIPESADRLQVSYLPVPIAAQLPIEDEIPLGDTIEQYVVLDFHDDISFGRLYSVGAQDISDVYGNVMAPGSLDFVTPTFGRPPGRATLWSMVPEGIQLEDLKNEGELRKMCVVLQDLFNSLWYRVDQMHHVPDPATCPRHLLDFMLHKFGNPFRFVPDSEQPRRRLAGQLRQMYRKLGTIGGIEAILEFFLEGIFDIEPLLVAGTWVLNQSILTLDTVLGGGSAYLRNCYLVRSYRTLTDEERKIITEICTWADPVNMHLVAIVEPGGTTGVTFWVLGSSILGSTTTLSL